MAHSSNMQNDSLAKVYAQALFEMALEQGVLDEVATQVQQLANLLEEHDDLQRLLASRMLNAEQRAGVIERVFRGRVHDVLYKFLSVVNRKNRLDALPGICAVFATLMDEHAGKLAVDVQAATSLSESIRQQVAAALGAALSKTIELREQVNPELIGGIKLRIADQLYDASVATQLRLLKRRLIEK